MGLPYTDRRELLERLDLKGSHWQVPGLRHRRRPRPAGGDARAGPGGHRRQAPGQPLRAGTPLDRLAQDQERPARGRRRLRAGCRGRGAAATRSARCSSPWREKAPAHPCATRAASAPASPIASSTGSPACSRRSSARTSPWTAGPKPPRGAVLVEPRYVAEVEFIEWTSDGVLRAPSYKGLREDVAVPPAAFLDAGRPVRGGTEVTVEDRVLRVTNLDKVLYPDAGFTKRDVIEYLVHIAPVLLPHLEGRPLTLKRYPNGVDARALLREELAASTVPSGCSTTTVQMNSKTIDFTLAQDLPTLVWLGNLADLELHTSLSRAPRSSRPTMLVFDLDPGPPATIVECCRVALWLRGHVRGPRAEDRREDVGQQGDAGLPAAQRRRRSRTRRRSRSPRRSPSCSSSRRATSSSRG